MRLTSANPPPFGQWTGRPVGLLRPGTTGVSLKLHNANGPGRDGGSGSSYGTAIAPAPLCDNTLFCASR